MRILGFVRSIRGRARLARDTSGWADLTLVPTATGAHSALRSGDRLDALVLELDTATDVAAHEAFLRRVREGFPSLLIVLYGPLTREAAKQIIRLANAGADELLLDDEDEERY